jgi:hypothetical protein
MIVAAINAAISVFFIIVSSFHCAPIQGELSREGREGNPRGTERRIRRFALRAC